MSTITPRVTTALTRCGAPARSNPRRLVAFSIAVFACLVGGLAAAALAAETPATSMSTQPTPEAPNAPARPAPANAPGTDTPLPAPPGASAPEETTETSPIRPPVHREIVVYCDLSEDVARAVIAAFEERTKLKVRPVFPTGADGKSIDLADRLTAESAANQHPVDVWWSGEICRTLALARAKLLEPYQSESGEKQAGDDGWPKPLRAPDGSWYGIGRKVRVVAYHTMLVDPRELPKDLMGLADKRWAGRVGLADPANNSSRVMLASLHATDDGKFLSAWLEAMTANQMQVFDSETALVGALARGQIAIALSDSEAVLAGAKQLQPLRFRIMSPTQILGGGSVDPTAVRFSPGLLQAPQTVALIRNAPNKDQGVLFVDYLLCNEVAEILASQPGELIRHDEHSSLGFTRWCDGIPTAGRTPHFFVSLDGFDAAKLGEHDAAAVEAWTRRAEPRK